MTGIFSVLIKIYDILLRLYPVAFRREFTEEMLLDFSDMAVDANKKGTRSLIFFCLRELIDFPVSLLRAHAEETRMFRILRSQPVTIGLRSALGFGVAFGLTLPILIFTGQKLYPLIDPMVTYLQVAYYDRFHAEQGFELISWIPSAVSFLLIGLVLGVLFAVLFADRPRYRHYILAGMLGWFFYNAMHDLLTIFFNFGGFLDGAQTTAFSHMLRAFSGTVFGLIFVVAMSERPGSIRLLTISIFVYPLVTSLLAGQLFDFFVFRTPWRFVGSTILMVALVTSVLILARKIDGGRRVPILVVSTVGYPLIMFVAYLVAGQISPLLSLADLFNSFNPASWQRIFMVAIEQAIYGILLGLLLGLAFGYSRTGDAPQLEEI